MPFPTPFSVKLQHAQKIARKSDVQFPRYHRSTPDARYKRASTYVSAFNTLCCFYIITEYRRHRYKI